MVDSASVGVDPAADRIWIVGGYVDNRDAQSRTPIAEATAYDAEGRPIETAPVPVQADRFAFNPGVAFVGEDMFAVGPECPLPTGDEGGCSQASGLLLARVGGDNPDRLDLEGAPLATSGADALSTRVVGSDDNSIFVVQATSGAPAGQPNPAATGALSPVRLYKVLPGARRAEEVALPPGVVTPGSVCHDGATLFAAVPELTEGTHLHRVAIYVHSPSSTWEQLGTIELAIPDASGGSLYCVGGDVLVRVDRGGGDVQFEAFDVARRAPTALPPQAPRPRGRVSAVVSSTTGLVVTTISDSDRSVSYYRYTGSAWVQLRGRPLVNGRPDTPIGVALRQQVVDAAVLKLTPPAAQRSHPTRPYVAEP